MELKGRRPIYSDVSKITRANVLDVLKKAMNIHSANRAEIVYLQNYERGIQPIKNRKKDVRPEINNRVVENHASEIKTFYSGYIFAKGVSYVQRAENDLRDNNGNADDVRILGLNEMMFEEGKTSKDQELANDFLITGVGYRMLLPRQEIIGVSPFYLLHLDVRNTFVIYSSDVFHRRLAGVTYYRDENNIVHWTVYTDEDVFFINGNNFFTPVEFIKVERNYIGIEPIIEYKANFERMGIFERVLPLLDALNACTSDRLNGLEQYINAFIWFNNVEIDDEQIATLKDKLILLTQNVDGTNNPASVQYLTANLNQDDTQTLADYLYNQILQIAGVPSREGGTSGETGIAVEYRNGWQIASTNASTIENAFEISERELLRVAIAIIEKSHIEGVDMSGLKVSDIEIKPARSRTDNFVAKVQGIAQGIQAGLHPQHMIAVSGLFSDPQQVYIDSKPFLEKWLLSTSDDEEEHHHDDEVDNNADNEVNDEENNGRK